MRKTDLEQGWERPKQRRKVKRPAPSATVGASPSPVAKSDRGGPCGDVAMKPRTKFGGSSIPCNFDSRHGRAGEWPFVDEDYTYRIVHLPEWPPMYGPSREAMDMQTEYLQSSCSYFDPRLLPRPPCEVALTEKPGWLSGFRSFPRDILQMIFLRLCDWDTVCHLRRVCKAWRVFVTNMPVQVKCSWKVSSKNERAKVKQVSVSSMQLVQVYFKNLISLELDECTKINLEAFETLRSLGSQLVRLAFDVPELAVEDEVDLLRNFSALTSLTVRATGKTSIRSIFQELSGKKASPFLLLHTLTFATRVASPRGAFDIDAHTRFPMLTSLTVRNSFSRITLSHPSVQQSLTHLDLTGRFAVTPIHSAHGLKVLRLRDVQIPLLHVPYTSVTSLDLSGEGPWVYQQYKWIKNFLSLLFLDVSGGYSGYTKYAVVLQSWPSTLRVLRAVNSEYDWVSWIRSGGGPNLIRVIARSKEFTPEVQKLLHARQIEMVS